MVDCEMNPCWVQPQVEVTQECPKGCNNQHSGSKVCAYMYNYRWVACIILSHLRTHYPPSLHSTTAHSHSPHNALHSPSVTTAHVLACISIYTATPAITSWLCANGDMYLRTFAQSTNTY